MFMIFILILRQGLDWRGTPPCWMYCKVSTAVCKCIWISEFEPRHLSLFYLSQKCVPACPHFFFQSPSPSRSCYLAAILKCLQELVWVYFELLSLISVFTKTKNITVSLRNELRIWLVGNGCFEYGLQTLMVICDLGGGDETTVRWSQFAVTIELGQVGNYMPSICDTTAISCNKLGENHDLHAQMFTLITYLQSPKTAPQIVT